jgi:uncharacterized Ntn-hydrolase superfamily protein
MRKQGQFTIPATLIGAVLATAAGCGHSATNRSLSTPSCDAEADKSATFSIVAYDPESGECGAAVASKYPAVGTVVPFARGGVGAFCTQHYHNPAFGPRALELLAAGKTPQQVIATLLADDPGAAGRQLAVIDCQGRTAQHNPTAAPENSRWWGAMSGRFYACQGNTLASAEVVTAMARAYEATAGPLADRLLAALVAGDRAGGDHRGRLAAGLIVAKPGDTEPSINWQVDKSDDAVNELARKMAK